eukprot:gene42524-60703_t
MVPVSGALRPATLLAVDFDLTLTMERVYGRRDFGRVPSLFGGPRRAAALATFLAAARGGGCRVVVASWNFADEHAPQNVLVSFSWFPVLLGLLRYVDAVYDRTDVDPRGGHRRGKAALMRELCAAASVELPDGAVFVDDHADALDGMPCRTHHVAGESGMTDADIAAVCALLRVDAPVAPPPAEALGTGADADAPARDNVVAALELMLSFYARLASGDRFGHALLPGGVVSAPKDCLRDVQAAARACDVIVALSAAGRCDARAAAAAWRAARGTLAAAAARGADRPNA